MVSISPSVDYLERAYDDAVAGRFSREPYVDMGFPTAIDPSVAPPGKHVMACFVQYAPYELAEGTWDDQREAFGDTVQATIAKYAPDLPSQILHRQVLTPLDIERRFGLSEGNIFQGELLLEQLFAERPMPGCGYRTPVRDLWLCGSSTHPGGVITGRAGPQRGDGGAARRGARGGRGAGTGMTLGRAIVIGAGHNGLVCACYLARAGLARAGAREARPTSAAWPRRPSCCPASACRLWPTRSAGSGRRSRASSDCATTDCRWSSRTPTFSRHSPTAGADAVGQRRANGGRDDRGQAIAAADGNA